MAESHTNPDLSAETSNIIDEVQKEVTSALDGTPDTTKASEQPSAASTDAAHDAGPISTNEPGIQTGMEQSTSDAEGVKEKKDENQGENGGESAEGQDHLGDTTKDGKPAQIGEKRTHPKDTSNETAERNGGDAADTDAKRLKTDEAPAQTDESKPGEGEAPATKGKGGRRKSTRKGTAAAAANTNTNTDGKKKPVGRPRKNAAPAQTEDKKDGGEEKMETDPVGSKN